MRRIIAVLLALVLTVGFVPTLASAQSGDGDAAFAERYPQAVEIWKSIEQAENEQIAKRSGSFSEAAKKAYALVEASESTEPGSLERHGEAFFWRTVDGAACGYNPAFRERVIKSALGADAANETNAAVRGGVAGSANVAVFQPYYGIDTSFTTQYADEGASIAAALGGTCTVYKTKNATIDNIARALETCAVVIFDSHGDTDWNNGDDCVSRANTSYICLQSGSGITSEDQKVVTGKYGRYYHAYYGGSYYTMQYYMVDGTAIANHMNQNAPNNLLWMAICLGMATDGMNKPLRGKGVEMVYGYSQSVTFNGDYAYEESFFNAMKQGSTAMSAIAQMKRELGDWDPVYKGYSQAYVTRNYVAFPVVASGEDAYPGQGNVDRAQAVYSKLRLMESDFLLGDVNGDGKVSVSDASMLLRYVVKTETLEREQLLRADVNADCKITSSDASEILRYIVGLEKKLTAEP